MSGPLANVPFGIADPRPDRQGPTLGTVDEDPDGYSPSPPTGPLTSEPAVAPAVNHVNDGSGQSGPVVTDVENFEAMSDREMTARVVSITPATASEFSMAWTQFSRSIEAASSALESDVRPGDEAGFEGALPDTVRNTHRSFVNSARAFADVVASPSSKLDGFADILNTVQNRFTFLSVLLGPELPASATGGGLPSPNPMLTALMESTYSPAVLDAGSQLPVLPGPFDLSAGGDQSSGGLARESSGNHGVPTSADIGSPQGTAGGPGSGTSPVGAAGSDGQSLDPAVQHSGNDAGPTGADASSGRPVTDAAISQAGLSPSSEGAQPPASGSPSTRVAPSGGAASLGGGALPVAGPMGGSTAAGRTGIGGGSGVRGGGQAGTAGGTGGVGGRTAGAPALSTVNGGPPGTAKGGIVRGPGMGAGGEGGLNNAMAGRRGMGGSMMGGAGRGRGQDEDAYSPAEFLSSIDNGDTLIGPLPRVVHPVIGDWGER